MEALRSHHAYAFAIWLIYAGRSSFIQFWEGSLVCGVYQWRSILRNIIFQADKVHRSDPNCTVPRGSDVIMWISWLHIKAATIPASSALLYGAGSLKDPL